MGGYVGGLGDLDGLGGGEEPSDVVDKECKAPGLVRGRTSPS